METNDRNSPPNIEALVDAAWQVLDDMGTSGQSCCLYAKARLRAAIAPFEPGLDGDDSLPLDWPVSEAERIIEDVHKR